jgi:uncharacterized protein with PQ loop repeat
MKFGFVILKSLQIIDTLEMSPQIFKYFQTPAKNEDFLIFMSFRFSDISKCSWISEVLFSKWFVIIEIHKNCL